MSNRCVWYECSYPGLSDTYFVNVTTGMVVNSVSDRTGSIQYLKDIQYKSDDKNIICYYCCRVKKTYLKRSVREIDLIKGEFVFVKSRPINGWVYIETIGNRCGYAPFSYLEPLLNKRESTPLSKSSSQIDSIHVSLRSKPIQSNLNRHTYNTSNRLSDIDNSYRHRCRNYSYNISSQGSQTENAFIQLLSSMLPMYIRKVFSQGPTTPYDIWLIDVTRRALSLSQSAFQRIIQDCGVDIALYNELLSNMNDIGQSNEFIEFEVSENIRCNSLLQCHNIKSDKHTIPDSSVSKLPEEKMVLTPVEENKESKEEVKQPEEQLSTEATKETVSEEPLSTEATKETIPEESSPTEASVSISEETERDPREAYVSDPLTSIYSDIFLYDFRFYASIYFQREKPRLFHPFSLEELASYNGCIPLLPLHHIPLNSQLHFTVIEVERKILMYMNIISYENEKGSQVETAEEREERVLSEIVYQSVMSQDFFDEILCYLIKQTNNNPNEESQIQGFRLLFMLMNLRRPSYHLLKYVLNYLYQQLVHPQLLGSLSLATMQLLLNDNYLPEEQCYSSEKYKQARKQLDQIPEKGLAIELLENASLQDIIRMEKTAFLLLKHGIIPPTNTTYAWETQIPSCSLNECNFRQYLNPLLQGIIVFIRTHDSKDFKERVFSLHPSLLKLTWVSIHTNKPKMSEVYLRDITGVIRVGDPIEYTGSDNCYLYAIQLFGYEAESTIDIAVRCQHERDRLLQFLNSYNKWYTLHKDIEIKKIMEKYHFMEETEIEEQQNTSGFYRDMKRSLENYFNKTQLLSSGTRYYSTINGYDFLSMNAPSKAIQMSGSASSSFNSSQNNSLSDKKSHNSSLKHNIDLSAYKTQSYDSFSKAGIHSPSNNNSLSHPIFTNDMECIVLKDLIEYEYHPQIPRLLQILCRQLVNLEGYKEEGIFRMSASIDESTRLHSALSIGKYEEILTVESVHTIASKMYSNSNKGLDLIKDFVRCLSPLLVPSVLWDDIVRIGKKGSNANVDEAWKILKSIPEDNFITLMYLLTMMYKFSMVESNKMNISAFMIVLAPNIIEREPREGEDEDTANILYVRTCGFVNNYFSIITQSLPEHFDLSIFENDFPIN